MKYFHGILSMVLGVFSLYVMLFKKELIVINPRDLNFILGFGILLLAIIFFSFMLFEEKQEEVSQLRKIVNYLNTELFDRQKLK